MEVVAQHLEMPVLESAVDRRPWIAAAASHPQTGVSFATITDLKAFEAIGPEWSALFEAYGRPHQVFQAFEWLAIWAPLYVDGRTRLSIVTGRIDGRLVLVWPLVVQRTFGLRVLAFMGEPLSQYGDALIADELGETDADAAFDYVMALPVDVIALRRVRDDAAISPLMRRRLGSPVNRQASPYVDLSGCGGVEDFDKRFSGKLRASRRRRRRRIEERGALSFEHLRPSPEAAELVATALSFKRDWACQAGVLAPALRDSRFEQFFVAAALAGRNEPALRVSRLRCGSEVLGAEISIACKGHLFGHVLAPRPGFAALGLGGLLAEQIILNALKEGYAAVDLLAPADRYKLEWTTAFVGVGDYCMSLSLLGLLYTRLWLRFGRAVLKRLASRLRPGIAALIGRQFSRHRLDSDRSS